MGKTTRLLVLVLAATALAASATPYQQMGFRGGVEETRLGNDTWIITAKGNAFTSRSTIVEYSYRRADELCPGGFDVIDADRTTTTSAVSFNQGRTYSDVDRSEATLVVRCRVQACWETRGVKTCEIRRPGR